MFEVENARRFFAKQSELCVLLTQKRSNTVTCIALSGIVGFPIVGTRCSHLLSFEDVPRETIIGKLGLLGTRRRDLEWSLADGCLNVFRGPFVRGQAESDLSHESFDAGRRSGVVGRGIRGGRRSFFLREHLRYFFHVWE